MEPCDSKSPSAKPCVGNKDHDGRHASAWVKVKGQRPDGAAIAYRIRSVWKKAE